MAAGILLSAMSIPFAATGRAAADGGDKLTENQKILHVLNRLGFGPRAVDVERVRAMGLEKYIELQLNPASLDDKAAELRLANLEVFGMTTAEIFAKYPNPGALLRQLEGGNRQQNAAGRANAGTPPEPETPEEQQRQQRERRQKLEQLYREYNLRPAGQILPQIVGNRVIRAAYSERQLQEVMVDFWQNHFNVFSGKAAVRWYIPSYERDVLRKNALGNFRDLVVGTARHPAMLFYLDNFESVAPNAQNRANNPAANRVLRQIQSGNLSPRMREQIKRQRGITDAELDEFIRQARNNPQAGQQRNQRGLNENYARELMELHTLGVDGGYTQKDIIEVARAFTGWTIADPRGFQRAAAEMISGSEGRPNRGRRQAARLPGNVESGEFYFNNNWHDKDAKMVLGQKINEGGINDGMKVIDLLVAHASTAKFIARKLAVKFVSDNPDEAFVGRIAEAFQKSRGDIKTTLRAIFSDKEFFAAKNYRAKIKTPFELAVSSIRALNAETNASPALLAMLNKLGEVPYGYQAPTGYPDTAEDWVNTGALLERLNFAIAVSSNRIPGTRVDLRAFAGEDKSEILDKAISQILNGEIAPETRTMLAKRFEQPLPDINAGNQIDDDAEEPPDMRLAGAGRADRNRQARLLNPTGNPDIFKAVSLVLGTPEFQRQ